MFSIFNKSSKVRDINWLGIDIHSHILPGIDDGSPDVDTSLHFVRSLANLGFEKLIASPHIFKELYPNNKSTISNAQMSLQAAMNKEDVCLKLGIAGAEYMIDQDFNSEEELCLLDGKHLLIEMSYLAENPNITNHIFDLEIKGYRPVLAHPERYIYYFKDLSRVKRFKENGCFLQLNLLSIVGYYGKEVKKSAEILLKENLYDFAGTDLHHDRHLSALTIAIKSGMLHEVLGNYPFKNKSIFA